MLDLCDCLQSLRTSIDELLTFCDENNFETSLASSIAVKLANKSTNLYI